MKLVNTIILVFIVIQSYANTDKYRLILRSDPATTATIAWNQISGSDAVVYYGETDHGTNFSSYPNIAKVNRSTSFKGMENKFVRLTNLKPNTAYYFVIKDNEQTSQRFWFKTAPADKSRLSFIAGGDSRNNRIPRRKANSLVAKLKPHAVLFGGDMTNDDTAREWQRWMDDWQLTTAKDGRMFPIIAARGNHEDSNQVIYDLFDSPTEKVYYALTFGDNLYRFYTLNSFVSVGGDQKTWLEKDLKENSHVTWKSAQYHKPIRPHTSFKREYPSQYVAWANLFYDHGVRLVVECDSHMVKTTYPVKPSTGFSDNEGFIREDMNGTVYTGEGCWGAPLRPNDDDKVWTQDSGIFNQFKLIFVDEDKIELRTIKINNADEVGENSNNDVFTLPENLKVWKMDDQDKTEVVYIYKNNYNDIEVEFSKTMPNIFNTKNINISLDFKSSTDQIKEVKYSAVNSESGQTIILGVTNQVTKEFNANIPVNGPYRLIAEIKRADNQTITIEKDIYVGEFSTELTNSLFIGSDDISEEEDGDIVLDHKNLHLGYRIFGGFESIGLRFDKLEIPKNATINFAYILFTPLESNSNRADGLIQVEDTSNSQPFSKANAELRNRIKATEEVIWQIPEWKKDEIGDATKTPDLKELVQNVIDKNNWQKGNAITFSIQPTNLTKERNNFNRVAYAYENNPEKSPKLVYGFSYNSSDWAAIAEVTGGVGINTDSPKTPLDVNGLIRGSVRNENGELYKCDESIEGAVGYDVKEKNIKVCTKKDGVYQWTIINL